MAGFPALKTLDQVILHTVVHRSSTSTYTPNFTEIEETSCGRTDVRAYVRTYAHTNGHLRPVLISQLARFDLKSITYS